MTTKNTKDTKVLFNDILGTTVGSVENSAFSATTTTAFGSGNNDAFFTGKPHIEGLGYVFLFRNYKPETGKWQTADPLGYPDGWNNLAYVNNGVTGCLDPLGGDVYHYVDTEGGVAGSGHSAWVVGNTSDGYTAYDFGMESSGNQASRTQGGFTTPEAALAFLNSNRSQEHNYDKGQMWESTPFEDAAANLAAGKYMQEDYSLMNHNCYHLGPDAILDAINTLRDSPNYIFAHPGNYLVYPYLPYDPNLAFNYNNGWGNANLIFE